MRGTLSLPSSRDPDILERLQPQHLQNICSRMQSHYNVCAMQIANDQGTIMGQIKEVTNISSINFEFNLIEFFIYIFRWITK